MEEGVEHERSHLIVKNGTKGFEHVFKICGEEFGGSGEDGVVAVVRESGMEEMGGNWRW